VEGGEEEGFSAPLGIPSRSKRCPNLLRVSWRAYYNATIGDAMDDCSLGYHLFTMFANVSAVQLLTNYTGCSNVILKI
jgi:hypothetical protein